MITRERCLELHAEWREHQRIAAARARGEETRQRIERAQACRGEGKLWPELIADALAQAEEGRRA